MGLVLNVVEPDEGVLHPILVVSLGEVVSCMGSTGFLAILCGIDSHLSLEKEILELEGLDKICVPDVTAVCDADVLIHVTDVIELLASLFEKILLSEDGSVALHYLLHGYADLGSWLFALRVAKTVEVRYCLLACTLGEFFLGLARLELFNCCVSGSATKDHEVKERVCTETVSSMHRCTSNLAGSQKARNYLVFSVSTLCDDVCLPVCWHSSHVVMDSWYDRDRFLSHINACKDVGSL